MKGRILYLILITFSLSTSHTFAEFMFEEERVSHGEQAQIGQFKSVVFLIFEMQSINDSVFINVCSGAIISKHWVMTAAHCLGFHIFYKSFYPEEITSYAIGIVAGVNDHTTLVKSRQFRTANASQYFTNPGSYSFITILPKSQMKDFLNAFGDNADIALIFVTEPFEFNDEVGSITLARNYINKEIKNPNPCYSVGFGMATEVGVTSTMHFIHVSAGGKTFCNEVKEGDEDTGNGFYYVICSKGSGYGNICKGDSGGPLICGDNESRLSLGVASTYSMKPDGVHHADMGCGKSRKGVTTYVFPGVEEDWINDVTDSPNFVAFLRTGAFNGAQTCGSWPLMVLFLLRLALFSGF